MRKRTLFTAIWLLICLVALEGTLQLIYRVRAGDWLARRTVLPLYREDGSGFRLRPHLDLAHATPEFRTRIVTDRHGFRVAIPGPGPAVAKSPGTRRILLLGPSFAFGWGVDAGETFLARLARLLAPESEEPLELINAGVPALGPLQQLDWFRREGAAFAPDLVLQVVYGSLEVTREYSDGLRVDARGYLVPRNPPPGARWRGLAKRSALVFHTWSAATALSRARAKEAGEPGVRGAGRPLTSGPGVDPGSPAAREALAFYEELRAATGAAGAELLVVYLPLSWRVHPEDEARWRHLGLENPAAAAARDGAWLALLGERGIPVLDLTPALLEAAAGGARLYYAVDIHWNAAGHAVAARKIAARLATGRKARRTSTPHTP